MLSDFEEYRNSLLMKLHCDIRIGESESTKLGADEELVPVTATTLHQ